MLKKYRHKRLLARTNMEGAQYDAADKQLADIDGIGIVALESALADGQVYIQSLYAAHNASDNRGLAFGSILTSAGSALYIFPLLQKEPAFSNDVLLISTSLGIVLFACGVFSFASVWPKKFCLPGSPPDGWLAKNWFKPTDHSKTNVLVEQLKAIQYQVNRNRELAKIKAYIQRASLSIALLAIAVAGVTSRLSVP